MLLGKEKAGAVEKVTRQHLVFQGVFFPRRFTDQGLGRGQESVEHAKTRPPLGLMDEAVAATLAPEPHTLHPTERPIGAAQGLNAAAPPQSPAT